MSIGKKSYSGTGINGTTLGVAIEMANSKASIRHLQAPPGWSWAKLDIDENAAIFRFNYITKVAPRDETVVYLNPFGYIFFRTKNTEEDFGFSKTLSVKKILSNLEALGYNLDSTCQKNLLAATITGYAYYAVFVGVIAFLIAMAIIDPPHMK